MLKVQSRASLDELTGKAKPQPSKSEPARPSGPSPLDTATEALVQAAGQMAQAAQIMAQAASQRQEPATAKKLQATFNRDDQGRITSAIIDVI